MNKDNIYKLKSDLLNQIKESQIPFFVEKNKFIRFLNNNDNNFYDRENKEGHITSSCFCVNDDLTKILLVKHKKFGCWLQPGGHWDDISNENITVYENAIKEVKEECFGNKDFPFSVMLKNQIFNLDSHSAGDHDHYDVGYLIKIDDSINIVYDPRESDGIQWFDIDLICNCEKDFTSSRVKEVFNYIKNNKDYLLELSKDSKNNLKM